MTIVGIGTSAGGIEAMKELLENLSPDTGMTFIYVQHLDRNHTSNLAEIFGRSTKMKIETAAEGTALQPNTIYIIPPNKGISFQDGMLHLSVRPASPDLHLPINVLFLSLAENHGDKTIGIVLSGMASDGALGIKAIKQAGGITFAQNESAKFDSMPHAAIATEGVDAVLSPREIALELGRIARDSKILDGRIEADGPVEEKASDDEKSIAANQSVNDGIAAILQLLKKFHGVDFSHYKSNTIRRRILRRVLLHKLESIGEYVQMLRRNTDEITRLYKDLLINVTQFFRDVESTEYLKEKIIPGLLKKKPENATLRIWVAACSTGEEAYSMAMLIREMLPDGEVNIPVQIFATDLSEVAIAKARSGIYSITDVQMISPARLNRFFRKVDGHYQIIKSIRDICVFATHNLFKDPPFSNVDIISCCNVLIYLDTILQKRIMTNFNYSLKTHGFLVLGQSETVGSSVQYFSQVKNKIKIYTKKGKEKGRSLYELNIGQLDREPYQALPKAPADINISENLGFDKQVDKIILTDFSPAAVVVNQDLDIVAFRGSTSPYLEPAPGQASLNLLKMARSGLAFELRNGARKVFKTQEPFKKSGIEINHKSAKYLVGFTITPLSPKPELNLLLIVFEESKVSNVLNVKGRNSKDRQVKQLENELLSLREDMRMVLEAQESVNEELHSANEEILSSNEELQSINEEIETSKEEIEATNEELQTINQELVVRNDQLAEAAIYHEAVMSTIAEAVLIADANLKIKSGNDAFFRHFKTSQKQIEGHHISEIDNGRLNIPALMTYLNGLKEEVIQLNKLEIKQTFHNSDDKILLVNASKIVQPTYDQELVIIGFEDITELKQSAYLLKERADWLTNMTDNLPVLIWVADLTRNFTYLNKTWLAYTGRTIDQEKGIGWTEGIHEDDIKECLSNYHNAFSKKVPFKLNHRLKNKEGEYKWVINTAVPTFDINQQFTGFIGSVMLIDESKTESETDDRLVNDRIESLQNSLRALTKTNEELQQFAYNSSHDLQAPLRKVITFAGRLKKRFTGDLSEDAHGYLKKIEQSSKSMMKLVEDLFNYSQAFKPIEKPVSTDLNIILKSSLQQLENEIKAKAAQISTEPLPVIEGIPTKIGQIFYQLVSNALTFVADGATPVLHISCRKLATAEKNEIIGLPAAANYYEIIFKDEGVGFSTGHAEKIFEIFYRINHNRRLEGNGIGLALSKKIVEIHHGKIIARPAALKGAEFVLYLPERF